MQQDKQKEKDFFDKLAEVESYNVFTDSANQKIIQTVEHLLNVKSGDQIIDFGCGSGVFTGLLQAKGYRCIGIDLSEKLLKRGKQQIPQIDFLQADVELLPFLDNSVDAIMLSCLLHHLPDPSRCIQEVFRVLKPNGRVVAFDPNRLNPFMYLYRDRSSPFYSSEGVTENERPVLPWHLKKLFKTVGFQTQTQFVDGLSYRYVASSTAKGILPIYNFIDKLFFKPFWMKPFRAFVFTHAVKPLAI